MAARRVLQARVPILPGDTEATLSQRVLMQEHIIYPLAVNWFCQGRLRCEDGKAWLDGRPLNEPVQIGDLTAGEILMKMFAGALFSLAIAASADAGAQTPGEAGIAPFIAHYEADWKGISVGTSEIQLTRGTEPGQYLYTWTITAHGIFRIAYQRRSRAEELVENDRRSCAPG